MDPLNPPLVPRDGHVLKVLIIGRVSSPGPGRQDIRSLDDQQSLSQEWLTRHWDDNPVDITVVAGAGSGELLDRAETGEATQLVESGEFDLVICEDLSRIMRRMQAFLFCELCEDHDTRLIAINDQIDTANEWRMAAFFASFRHEMSNTDSSRRVRRTLRSRFQAGGVVQSVPSGYIKPHAHATDAECSKDPEAEAIYDEWFRRLEDGQSFAAVADWLNAIEFPVSSASRQTAWNGTAVGRTTRNPILKGLRLRNVKMARRINRTGHRRSVPAPPEELLQRECPHLAFIEPERYDRVIRMLRHRNESYRRGRNGHDTRVNVPRSQTRWPGQHMYCGICGRLYVYGGHGQRDRLMCQGARDHACWNGVTADGPLAASKMSAAIMSSIEAWPEYDAELVALVERELSEHAQERDRRLAEIDRREAQLHQSSRNVLDAIGAGGVSALLSAEITRIEQELDELRFVRDTLVAVPAPTLELPPLEVLKQTARECFQGLAANSHEFGQAIRRLIPRIEVFPYQLLDGGKPDLRAAFDLDLSPLASGGQANLTGLTALRRTHVVDLFDPPQREEFRERVVALRQTTTEKEAAAELGITVTAASRAMGLQRRMNTIGVTDAYLPLREPPSGNNRFRRHRHERYEFNPLPGYESPRFPTG